MTTSYQKYVVDQSRRNPCLHNLCQFLAEDKDRNECRIVSLDFGPIDGGVQESELSSVELAETLSSQMKSNQGRRLLVVEDLTKDVVELLGSYLDIDPLFFASHIYRPHVEMSSCRPSTATLPSKTKIQNFLSLHYQHAIEFESQPLAPRKLFCDGNVARKVVILPPTKNMHIGLVQHGCSIWKGATKKNSWLGMISNQRGKLDTYTNGRHNPRRCIRVSEVQFVRKAGRAHFKAIPRWI